MKAYHITYTDNVKSILHSGIRPSIGGADGPGVYVWIGTIKDVLQNADTMMFDGTDMSEIEQLNKMSLFTVLEVDLPFDLEDDDVFDKWVTAAWEDYIVLRDAVPWDSVSIFGNFCELVLKYSGTSQDSRLTDMDLSGS